MCACAGVRPPLRVLQARQALTTFSQVSRPPLDRGRTWSRVSCGRANCWPQYRHRWASRANRAVLDSAGVARAAMESLAENTSDGIVAPLFWGAIFGLPGIAAYKAINTLDSMIGHRTPRFQAFGWASARIDDLVNLVPARLTGLVFALVSSAPRRALSVMWRDAGLHRSPNAGWPEAAMAAGLGVRLSGPRVYDGHVADEPWVNAGTPDPTANDLQRGLALYVRAMFVLAAALLVLALV